jgi:hypothetical protein
LSIHPPKEEGRDNRERKQKSKKREREKKGRQDPF